jgi:hypothetical protein
MWRWLRGPPRRAAAPPPADQGNGHAAAAARDRAEKRLVQARRDQAEVHRLVDSLGADIERAMRRRTA